MSLGYVLGSDEEGELGSNMSEIKYKIPQVYFHSSSAALRFSLVPNNGYNIRMCVY